MRQGSDKPKDTRRDVMLQGLWGPQFHSIIDVKLGDVGADMYKYKPMTTPFGQVGKDQERQSW